MIKKEITEIKKAESILNFAAGVCAAILVLLGIVVIFGWYTGNLILNQVSPNFTAMVYNSAASFIFCGAAIFLILRGRFIFAALSSCVPLSFGGLKAVEYFFKIDFGIDNLLFKHFLIMPHSTNPGSMALNTAVCFIFSGVALLGITALARRKTAPPLWFLFFLGNIILTVFSLGVTALSGYLLNIPTAYGWGDYTRMAANTAFGFIIFGSGIFILFLREAAKSKTRAIFLYPVLTLSGCLIFTFFFAQGILGSKYYGLIQDIKIESNGAQWTISNQLELRIQALERMAKRFSAEENLPEKTRWTLDAKAYLENFLSIELVAWVGSHFEMQWVEARENSLKDSGSWLSAGYLEVLRIAKNSRKISVAVRAIPGKNEEGLLVVLPLYNGDNFRGLILSVFNTQALMDDILHDEFRQKCFITLYDRGSKALVYQNIPGEGLKGNGRRQLSLFIQERRIKIYGLDWLLRIFPSRNYFRLFDTPLTNVTLILGLLLSFILAYLVYLIQKIREFNAGLEEAIARRTAELSKSREELKDAAVRWQGTFDAIGDAISILGLNGEILQCNAAMARLAGEPAGSIIGRACWELVHKTKEPVAGCPVVLMKKTLHRESLEIEMKKGWFNITADPIFNKDGSLVGAVHIIVDITSRKSVEKARENLLRNVSHSLKSPIALARMACSLGEEGVKNNDSQKINSGLRIASRNLDKIDRDVRNILRMSVLEYSAQVKKDNKEAHLTAIVNSILKVKEPVIIAKKLEVKINIPPGADKIALEENDLFLIMDNLIDNALKFTDSGSLSIEAKVEGELVRICVEDSGYGIKESDQNRIFEKFFKGNPARDGVGLGLAICKELVKVYNGKIEVISKGEGKGVVATLLLPKVL